jgi:aryl-alcohol dehydrogenase-like predicted oxidoreductase
VIVNAPNERRRLGAGGPSVFPLALGGLAMSGTYGPTDERESIATIQAALDAGVNLIDTGDYYAAGQNELLVGRALQGRRDRALLSVKFGALRGPDGAWLGIDTRPVAVRNFIGYTLKRLGVDYIDIYRPGRLDPAVPIEDTVGAIGDLVKAGYVRYVGLSEVGAETIRRAHAVHPISDLQIEYSLVSRSPERAILPVLGELGIGVTAYGVLSRGLLTGARPTARADMRAHFPRFSQGNLDRNQTAVDALAAAAARHGATPAQLAFAWVLAKGDAIVPILGARTRPQLADSLGALRISLTTSEIDELEAAISPAAIAGTRYDERQMRGLDSEK